QRQPESLQRVRLPQPALNPPSTIGPAYPSMYARFLRLLLFPVGGSYTLPATIPCSTIPRCRTSSRHYQSTATAQSRQDLCQTLARGEQSFHSLLQLSNSLAGIVGQGGCHRIHPGSISSRGELGLPTLSLRRWRLLRPWHLEVARGTLGPSPL